MPESQIEKSEGGTLVRVNTEKSTYTIIHNGAPVHGSGGDAKSILHPLPNIVLLGGSFELPPGVKSEAIEFFQASDGKMLVPFRDTSVSDVRQLVVDLQLKADLLPARVFHYSNYKVGMLPKGLPQPLYFAVESKVDRESLIRLKTLYPAAQIAIYKHEKTTVMAALDTGLKQAGISSVRATDIVQQGGAGELSENPAFVARIYLRKLDWAGMRNLPYRMIVSAEDATNILAFLSVMLKNERGVQELEENRASIKTLQDFYTLLSVFLTFSQVGVDTHLAKYEINPVYIAPLQKVLEAQQGLLGPDKNSDFFSYVYPKLEGLTSDNQ